MAGSSADGIKGIVGGIFTLAVVAGVIYLKFQRAEARAERREQREIAALVDMSGWKPHALDMMKQAPDQKTAGEYLAWGVETYHEDATEDAGSGPEYRDALVDLIYERARQDGREDVTRSLDKVKTMARLAKPETWWEIKKK
jgi:hypothetical protein